MSGVFLYALFMMATFVNGNSGIVRDCEGLEPQLSVFAVHKCLFKLNQIIKIRITANAQTDQEIKQFYALSPTAYAQHRAKFCKPPAGQVSQTL